MKTTSDEELLLTYLGEQLKGDAYDGLMDRLRREPPLVRKLLNLSADEELLREWAARDVVVVSGLDDDVLAEVTLPSGAKPQLRATNRKSTSRRLARLVTSKRLAWSVAALLVLVAVLGGWWISLPLAVARVNAVSSVAGLYQGFGWRTVRAGGLLHFDAGIVEMTLTNHVKLVLEGPCECHFDSADRIHLLAGRLFADVPASGHGLKIFTPDGEVVDWGTKFGVEVRRNERTEIHVFEGRVTAELADGAEAPKKDLVAGQAITMVANERRVDEIPLSEKFAREAGTYEEHFAYSGGALAGKGGWFDSGISPHKINVQHQRNIDYAGLQEGEGGGLEVYPRSPLPASPVGRRWHERFFSMLIYPDDDFPKRLRSDAATLVSFGSLSGPADADIRLVVRKSDKHDRQAASFGLTVDGVSAFESANRFRGFVPCLVVLRLGDDKVDLWIDPDSSTLGDWSAPPPSLTLKRSSPRPIEALWINDAANPPTAWFFIDALRGASKWADVTPPS